MAVFEMKAIAEAGLVEQRIVDEQTGKLEMWVLDANDTDTRKLRQEYATKRTSKLMEDSAARKAIYSAKLNEAAAWWGNGIGICLVLACLGLGGWFFRVQLLQDEKQRLEKRLLAAEVRKAEHDNRTIFMEGPS